MQLEEPEAQKLPAQPVAEPEHSGLSGFLKRSAHPVAIVFHFLFKILGITCYFFLGLIVSNSTLEFIIMVLLAAFDFWTVQNVTGRLLVGLRWRNRVKEDGSEEWVFESLNEDAQSNKGDLYAFWLGLLVAPLVWGIFLVANVLSLEPFESVLMLVCFILSGANLYGYYKCRKDHKQKLAGFFKQGAFNAASYAMKP